MRNLGQHCVDINRLLTGRPVGLAERDVYVTEARYNETDRQIRKLKGLKVSSFSFGSEWCDLLFVCCTV